MSEISPRLVLECKECGERPPEDSVQEALLLHFQVEHDTDQISLNLSAVCTCGTTMTFTGSSPTGGGFKDHYHCPACGNTGWVKRNA